MPGGSGPVRRALLGRSGRGVLLAWALAIALGALVQVATTAVTDGQELLDTRPGWTGDEARALLDELGASGRAGYGRLLPLDVAFGVSFGVAAAATSAWFRRRSQTSSARAASGAGVILGLAVALADVVEDAMFAVILASWPSYPAGVGAVASRITTVKLLLVAIVIGALVLLATGPMIRKLRTVRGAGS